MPCHHEVMNHCLLHSLPQAGGVYGTILFCPQEETVVNVPALLNAGSS